MSTIDLSTPPPPPTGLLDALPRRLTLTLPELQLVAELAGGAPLPFDVVAPPDAPSLEDRLGTSRGTTEDQAYTAALAALHDPRESLTRRGLLDATTVDDGLAGAVGLLATPEVAVDVDVAVDDATGTVQVKAWHRQAGDAVATLATADGLVFELAWFPTASWPAELARVGALPEDLTLRDSQVPAFVDLPFELADAALEAARSGRNDLVAVLAAQHDGAALDAVGRGLGQAETIQLVGALASETQGRLRVLVADVSGGTTDVVGVRSWILVADGWRTLHPHQVGDLARVGLRAIGAAELGADLAPVLSEVTA